jgi:hypothetical protein
MSLSRLSEVRSTCRKRSSAANRSTMRFCSSLITLLRIEIWLATGWQLDRFACKANYNRPMPARQSNAKFLSLTMW